MSAFTQILYHIVFGPKNRANCLTKEGRDTLFRYISGIIKNKNCFLYEVGGVEDHIHIATHLHPSVYLASLVKDIKVASSIYIKTNKLFPNFDGWQEKYAAFTHSYKEKDKLIAYIRNQEEHHRHISYREELIALLKEHCVEFDEKYLL